MSCTCDSFQTLKDDKWVCAECGSEKSSPFLAYDTEYDWVEGYPVRSGMYKIGCECGGEKTKTSHSVWCPKYEKM